MNLKEQQYVYEIYKAGSLTKASENLHITQSALSTFLASLEKTLGTKLFTRTNRNLIPTEAGMLYINAAKRMLALKDQFYIDLNLLNEDMSGNIHIGMQRIRSTVLSVRLTSYFAEKYPNISLQVSATKLITLYKMLKDDELDMIMSYYIPELLSSSDYVFYEIMKDPTIIVTGKDLHNRSDEATLQIQPISSMNTPDFTSIPFILLPQGHTMRYQADKIFQYYNFKPHKVIENGSLFTSLQLCSINYGAMLIMKSYLQEIPVKSGFNYYSIMPEKFSLPYGIIIRKDHLNTDFIEELLKYITSFINE